MQRTQRTGFTLIEILVVFAIMLVLGTIGIIHFRGIQERTEVQGVAEELVFHLEEMKAQSVAGTDGEAHGIHIEEDSYVQFVGSTYDADAEENNPQSIDDNVVISADPSDVDEIVFARITGAASEEVTLTVTHRNNPDIVWDIHIGTGGDISQSH